MRKLLITLPFVLICLQSFAPNVNKKMLEESKKRMEKFLLDKQKETLLRVVYQSEHPKNIREALSAEIREDAVGVLQIRPIMVKACNDIVGYQKYTMEDRRDSLKSVEMFFTYQNKFNPTYQTKHGALLWNGGECYMLYTDPKVVNRLRVYWEKAKQYL